jgi:hypothetical protein
VSIIITDEDPALPPVQEPKRPATTHEAITQARTLAELLRATLQAANETADPVASLVLIPMIGNAADLAGAINVLEAAMERMPTA